MEVYMSSCSDRRKLSSEFLHRVVTIIRTPNGNYSVQYKSTAENILAMLTKSNLCLWYHFTSNLSRCVTCFRNCELQRPATSPHSPGGFPRCCEHGQGIPLPMSISNKKLYKHSFFCYSKALCFSFSLTAFVTIQICLLDCESILFMWTVLLQYLKDYSTRKWLAAALGSTSVVHSWSWTGSTRERGVINPMATASSRLLTGMWFSVIFLWLCTANLSAFFLIYLVLLIVT